MGFFDPVVQIPRVTYQRIEALVQEVAYLEDDEELDGFELREHAEEFIKNILDEYVRQHFEESTKAAANFVIGSRKKRLR